MKIGTIIKEIRLQKLMTQQELCVLIDMAQPQLSAVENSSKLRASTIKKIAKALNVEPLGIWLFKGNQKTRKILLISIGMKKGLK